jgi:outer membrane protein assembly factor BamB
MTMSDRRLSQVFALLGMTLVVSCGGVKHTSDRRAAGGAAGAATAGSAAGAPGAAGSDLGGSGRDGGPLAGGKAGAETAGAAQADSGGAPNDGSGGNTGGTAPAGLAGGAGVPHSGAGGEPGQTGSGGVAGTAATGGAVGLGGSASGPCTPTIVARVAWAKAKANSYRGALAANGNPVVSVDGGLAELDQATGSVVWQYAGNSWFPSAAPDGTVFAAGFSPNTLAALAADGTELWKTTSFPGSSTNGLINIPVSPESVPVYIAGTFDAMFATALDPATGVVLWSVTADADTWTTAFSADGSVTYLADGTQVLAMATRSGETLWSYQAAGSISSIVAGGADRPLVSAGGALDPTSALVALDPATGLEAWSHSIEHGLRPVVVPGGPVLLSADSALHALNQSDGTELWTLPVTELYQTDRAVLMDGVAYFPSTTASTLYALAPATGEQLWTVTLPAAPTTVAADPANQLVYTVTASAILAWDSQGTQRWEVPRTGNLASVLVGNSGLVFLDDSDQIIAIRTGADVSEAGLACTPCITQCQSESSIAQCLTDGSAWGPVAACGPDQHCVTDHCEDCGPTANRTCVGSTVSSVDTCGRTQALYDCTSPEICRSATCVEDCTITACSASGFTYSCASATSTAEQDNDYDASGIRVGATLTVTYDNGHVVECDLYGTYFDSGTCSDDTRSTCSWPN